jgi:hypothetical protein
MHSFLSLGDSYTIGEGVPLADSFPYQTVQRLRLGGQPFYAPEIIARTGMTTDELLTAIRNTTLLPSYTVVTLLIGVNNQYRGGGIGEYATGFRELLDLALHLADSPRRTFVLSIPDWGVSPFAAGRDQMRISREIDDFNGTARAITHEQKVTFIDITSHSRTAGAFAADGLHPAKMTYAHWAQAVSSLINTI